MIFEERCVSFTAILELTKHKLFVTGEDGARGVAIILNSTLGLSHLLKKIIDHYGCLREDSSCCFRSGQVAGVTQTENIREAVVLECVDVDVEPSILLCQFTLSNEVRGTLRWHDMKHVKVLLDCVTSFQIRNSCYSVVFIDGGQVMAKVQIYFLAKALAGQSF